MGHPSSDFPPLLSLLIYDHSQTTVSTKTAILNTIPDQFTAIPTVSLLFSTFAKLLLGHLLQDFAFIMKPDEI
jgi:hypothetical protein